MITNGKKSHYLAVTNLFAFFDKNSSNHHGDFYFLNCFNSCTSRNKLKEHEEICNNHNSYRIEMPKWVQKILKHNPGEKSLKKPLAIYLDLEYLFILKLKIFLKIFLVMFENGLIRLTMIKMIKDLFQ